jgi:hypothetical protein
MKSFYTENGRMALYAYLATLETDRKYVIIPSLSCIGVIQAIKSAGFIPYYVEVDENFRYLESELENVPLEETVAIIYQAIYGGISFQREALFKSEEVRIIADMAQSFCLPEDFLKQFPMIDFLFLSFQKNKPLAFGIGGAGYSRFEMNLELESSRIGVVLKFALINLLFQIKRWVWRGDFLLDLIKRKFDSDRREGASLKITPHRLPKFLEIMLLDRMRNYDHSFKKERIDIITSYLDKNSKWNYLNAGFSYYSPHYIPIRIKDETRSRCLYDWPVSTMSPFQGVVDDYDSKKFSGAAKLSKEVNGLPINDEQSFSRSLCFLKNNIDKVI